MRAMWKGAVSFGLVNVPVRLYSATEEHDIRFHQVHRDDGGRIRYRRTCSVCGEEVGYDAIAKGYESEDGQLVVLTDEDLAALPVATGHEIDVMEFVPADQIDPIMFAKSYFLEPEKRAAKPYALLRQALSSTDRMAVVKVALRQRETLAVLRVRGEVILLQTMLWPDEIRSADFDVLSSEVDLRPQELAMATSLVDSLTGEFEPTQYEDEYAGAVQALIESKLGNADAVPMPAEAADSGGGEVVDLLTALQRSVDRAKAARGGATDGAAGPARPTGRGAGVRSARKGAEEPTPAPEAAAGEGGAGAVGGAGAAGAPAKPARRRSAAAVKKVDGSAAQEPAATRTSGSAGPKTAGPKTAGAKTAASKTAADETAADETGAVRKGRTAASAGRASSTRTTKSTSPRAAATTATTAAEGQPADEGSGTAPKRTTRRTTRKSA